jgi:hypothetical protein
LATGIYHWVFEADLVQRAGSLTDADWVVGVVLLVLVFEAARRTMGWALPIICGLFLAYGLFGQYLPAAFQHRGYGLDQIIGTLSFGTEGIYGTPTYVSSSYIFLFILFGAFLEQAGMIRLFNDFAMGTVGHTRGGPAKVAVISSGLMGTINGSGVANVVTTGQFTIPLMKRFGYSSAFAGGVEATSSMGGQIMPPVMGAWPSSWPRRSTSLRGRVQGGGHSGHPLLHHRVLDGAPGGRAQEPAGPAQGRVPQPWRPSAPAGTCCCRWPGWWPAVLGLHAAVLGHRGAGADGDADLGAACMQGVGGRRCGCCSGCWAWPRRASSSSASASSSCWSRCWWPSPSPCTRAGRAPAGGAGADRRRPPRAAGGHGLRHGGRHHRHINLTGVAAEMGGYIIALGRDKPVLALVLTMLTCLVLGMGIPPFPTTSSPARSPRRPAGAGRAADRLAHVRLLLRHHGRPDAAGGAGRLRRRADRASRA